jgi:DNA-binding PadR family transcriptional regulator
MKKSLTGSLLRHTVYYVKSNSYLSPPLLVLSSLADGDKHGYAMMEDIEHFAGVRLGAGTLYGAITRLEQHGWIRPVNPVDRRQPYTITGAGREYLLDQLAELERLVRTGQRRLKHT